MLSAKQGGFGSHFYSIWYDPAGDRTPASQSQGGRSNHKATELVVGLLILYVRSKNHILTKMSTTSQDGDKFGSICTLSELQTCNGHLGLALYVFV